MTMHRCVRYSFSIPSRSSLTEIPNDLWHSKRYRMLLCYTFEDCLFLFCSFLFVSRSFQNHDAENFLMAFLSAFKPFSYWSRCDSSFVCSQFSVRFVVASFFFLFLFWLFSGQFAISFSRPLLRWRCVMHTQLGPDPSSNRTSASIAPEFAFQLFLLCVCVSVILRMTLISNRSNRWASFDRWTCTSYKFASFTPFEFDLLKSLFSQFKLRTKLKIDCIPI